MIKRFSFLLLLFLLFSCSRNKNSNNFVENDKVLINEETNINGTKEKNDYANTFDSLRAYTIPGVNISFEYPEHKRIVHVREQKGLLINDETIYINDQVYQDYFFIHGNKDAFNMKFLKQYEKDGNHINAKKMLELIRNNEDSVLFEENLQSFYYEKRKFVYKNEIIGEEMINLDADSMGYHLAFVWESNLLTIGINYGNYDIKSDSYKEIIDAYPDLFYEYEDNYYKLKPEVSKEQLNNIIFNEPEDKLPEIILCFRKTIESVKKSLYIPQYDESYYTKLVNAGFSKDVKYEFMGATNPEYMFISTKEKGEKCNLAVFKNGNYYGKFSGLGLKPVYYEGEFIFGFNDFDGFYCKPEDYFDTGLEIDGKKYKFIKQ